MNVTDDLSDWLAFARRALTSVLHRWIATKVRVAYAKPTIDRKTWDDLLAADEKARDDVADVLSNSMAVADLLGRRRTIIEAESASGHSMRTPEPAPTEPAQPVAAPVAPRAPTPTVAKVAFREAVDDLLSRNARLAVGYKAVQEAYAKGHVYALAKSTDEVLTRRVQRMIASAIETGAPRPGVVRAIADLGGWTEHYAETVFVTNATTAYSAGRFAQARDKDIAKVCPAFEFVGRTVPPSRPSHIAAVGLVAATSDPIWDRMTPPLDYNCSHALRLVDRFTLRRRGLLREDGSVIRYEPPGFAAAGPAPGFGSGKVSTRFGF